MTRHPFEPARLLLGLLLLGVGLLYVLDALGETELRTPVLLSLVPAALVAGALTSMITFAVRRGLAHRRHGLEQGRGGDGTDGEAAGASGASVASGASGEDSLGDLPVDELRRGYARSRVREDGGEDGRAGGGGRGAAEG